ncbi:hypothetical protein [Plantactinospora sp. WMMB782]|uniref:hypothetical protein n=1 Tax=Plantactinospora sp. WMMB782 TaxID=3404121 RepID=UPI003B92738C
MAKGRTTYVTHPDGTRSKRTSATMTYTHAVQVGPGDPARYVQHLAHLSEKARKTAERISRALENPRLSLRDRRLGRSLSDGTDYFSHAATLAGTDIYTWASSAGEVRHGYPEEQITPALAYLVEVARKQVETELGRAKAWDEEAKAVSEGKRELPEYLRGWGVASWHSRRDLAEKAANARVASPYGERVRAVEVETE